MAAFVIIGLGTLGWFTAATMKIQDITISGSQSAKTMNISDTLKVRPGDSFWKTDVTKLQETVRAHKWVESARVRRTWNGKIQVDITEKRPQAVVSDGRGGFEFVDKDSSIIDRADATVDIAKYPVLSGRNLLRFDNLRKQAMELINDLPDQGALTKDTISEIEYADDKGFQMILSDNQMHVRLGKENLSTRLDRVKRVVQYLKDHRIAATHIDSDYAKKVLVKVQKPR